MTRKEIVALLLAGGQGSRLGVLTQNLAKPAVLFGGKYRIIDFTLSNCTNSGIDTVGVLTQYQPLKLNSHIGIGKPWDLDRINGGVTILAPYMKTEKGEWYSGTADAVYQNIHYVDEMAAKYVIILSGDHIYKMDYSKMLDFHKQNKADATISVIDVPLNEASRYGIMNTDEDGRIYEFEEKPENPKSTLASMGIYIFNWDLLKDYLINDHQKSATHHDFGKDIIPRAVKNGCAMAHSFDRSCVHAPEERPGKEDYWRDVGTVDAYWEANIDLTATEPALNLYDSHWPIWTYQQQLPPAKFVHNLADRHGVAIESMVSGGCIMSGEINRSLLYSACRVHSYAKVDWSVLLPEVDIGRGARLKRCIIDHGVRIPAGMVIGEDPAEDARRFRRTENGITLVTQQMIDKLS